MLCGLSTGRLAAALALFALASPRPAAAQAGTLPAGAGLAAGSDTEEYLRYLQTTGEVAPHPWSARGFGPREVERILPAAEGHPWAARRVVARDTSGAAVRLLPVSVRSWYNSDFPYATNDGPVWAGRGATVAAQAGVALRAGPLSVVVAPVAFVAQNLYFPLMDNGRLGPEIYRDARYNLIDLPQRFGDERYARVDPGESTLRLDMGGFAAGVTTAGQAWGPSSEHPLILATSGPGMPHVFAGTSRPVDIGIGRAHGRVLYAHLRHTTYSQIGEMPLRERVGTGLVGVLQPRGLTGLEVGAARFFHLFRPEGGVSKAFLATPFRGILDAGSNSAENQIASVYFRWVAAPSGLEVYGEYAREDYNANLRDLFLEPDHNAAYTLGLRRAWRPSPSRMIALRAETMDARVNRLVAIRSQTPFYLHVPMRQGHTLDGQLLGSRAAPGGAGSIVAVDLFHPRGRWTGMWMREQRGSSNNVWSQTSAGGEAVLGHGRAELRARLLGVWEYNYYFSTRDRFSMNAELGLQWRP